MILCKDDGFYMAVCNGDSHNNTNGYWHYINKICVFYCSRCRLAKMLGKRMSNGNGTVMKGGTFLLLGE